MINYIRVDHIGRPVFATNTAATKTWTASNLPFGEVRTTTGTPIALRFPGQWFQSESGLHQNWMRDYDPTTGRYLEADPLGLVDGASIYGYVKQNPGRWVDRRGTDATTAWNTTGGRSGFDGPTNGNWGGKCWSGGAFSCGPEGEGAAAPLDSADECYMRHDHCYVTCKADGQCIRRCDATLLEQLRDLGSDPRKWPHPPRRGTEGDTRSFINMANQFFGPHQ